MTPTPFTGTVKSLGNIATIKNDKGILTFSLEKTDIHGVINSGKNIIFSSGTIHTSQTPKFNNVTINNTPQNDTDAATVGYVKQFVQGIRVKKQVKYATTENIYLTGQIEVDGKLVQAGDRILVKDQTDPSENGLYVVNISGQWSRSLDFDEPSDVEGALVFVEDGMVNSAKEFIQTNNMPLIIGTDALNFSQFNGTYAFELGSGLTRDGSTLNIDTSLNFVTDMTGLTNVGVDGNTININSAINGPTIQRLDASMSDVVGRVSTLESSFSQDVAFKGSVDISGNLLGLNVGNTQSSAGLLIDRDNETNAIIGWDEDENKFILGLTNAINSKDNVGIVTKGVILADLSGNVETANNAVHSENVMLDVSGGNAVINGNIIPEGPNISKFMMDYNGNLIVKVNNLYFKYNLGNVSTIYNGES